MVVTPAVSACHCCYRWPDGGLGSSPRSQRPGRGTCLRTSPGDLALRAIRSGLFLRHRTVGCGDLGVDRGSRGAEETGAVGGLRDLCARLGVEPCRRTVVARPSWHLSGVAAATAVCRLGGRAVGPDRRVEPIAADRVRITPRVRPADDPQAAHRSDRLRRRMGGAGVLRPLRRWDRTGPAVAGESTAESRCAATGVGWPAPGFRLDGHAVGSRLGAALSRVHTSGLGATRSLGGAACLMATGADRCRRPQCPHGRAAMAAASVQWPRQRPASTGCGHREASSTG